MPRQHSSSTPGVRRNRDDGLNVSILGLKEKMTSLEGFEIPMANI